MFTIQLKSEKSVLFQIPQSSGVYAFFKNKKVIYIGKAVNLRGRLSSYFLSNIFGKTKIMMKQANYISYEKTLSELHAVFLEADLIKKYQPKYNVISKDDKSPVYIKLTKDFLPRILICRRKDLERDCRKYYGPFNSSRELKRIIRFIRPNFPFSTHKDERRICINYELGLCKPCPSAIYGEKDADIKRDLENQYLQNILYIKKIFSGRFKPVINELTKKRNLFVNTEAYEKALDIQNKIDHLSKLNNRPSNVVGDYFSNPNYLEDIVSKELSDLIGILNPYTAIKNLKRIECFDVAHLFGSFTTASMVVFQDGEARHDSYRHFRINNKFSADDLAALKETARRRFFHLKDWGKPDLLVIDGGINQINAFKGYFKNIPVVGLEKRNETLIVPVDNDSPLGYIKIRLEMGPAKNLVVRLRNEAHRFAQRYHHFLVKKAYRL